MKIKKLLCVGIMVLMPYASRSQSITTTVHNLSVAGPGEVKAASESEICLFCHTPHTSSPKPPLWNRQDPGSNYTLYQSSTTQATPGQPSGSSILCLSCHDGTIALGQVLSRVSPISLMGASSLAGRESGLETDLSDDHPVSFTYNASLANADDELVDPALLTGQIQLENGQMQCTACHDAHKDIYDNSLTVNNQYSELCVACHDKNYWDSTSHNTSTAVWNGSGTDPWFHTPFTNVSENACENCHNLHNAKGNNWLLNYVSEEDNCYVCHNNNVASTDIQSQLSKPYVHNVSTYNGIHDPEESNVVLTRHVECVDCHNPHASRNLSASAPNANGNLEGVKGVDTDGNAINPIQYEYELCYRCHADSPNKPGSPTTRLIEQNDVRLEFDLNNPSYHPIEGPGTNSNVPSLLSPYTEGSVIYCTDCHASDGSGSPAGPHGSIYPHILKDNYSTTDNTIESYFAYELCYKCHNRNVLISDNGGGFKRHRKHIVEQRTSCNICHDPHGISNSQGNSANNTHLINFEESVVSPEPGNGRLEFIDMGDSTGACYLVCHGETHHGDQYP